MSPPVLEGAHVVMVVVCHGVPHLQISPAGRQWRSRRRSTRARARSFYQESLEVDGGVLNPLVLPVDHLGQLWNVMAWDAVEWSEMIGLFLPPWFVRGGQHQQGEGYLRSSRRRCRTPGACTGGTCRTSGRGIGRHRQLWRRREESR